MLNELLFHFDFCGNFCQEGNWCEIPPQAFAIGLLGPKIEFLNIFFSPKFSQFISIFYTGFLDHLKDFFTFKFIVLQQPWWRIWFKHSCYLTKVGQVTLMSIQHKPTTTTSHHIPFWCKSTLQKKFFRSERKVFMSARKVFSSAQNVFRSGRKVLCLQGKFFVLQGKFLDLRGKFLGLRRKFLGLQRKF